MTIDRTKLNDDLAALASGYGKTLPDDTLDTLTHHVADVLDAPNAMTDHREATEQRWVIAGEVDPLNGEQLYWSNADGGWVDAGSADVFDRPDYRLPLGGRWEQAPDADGDHGEKVLVRNAAGHVVARIEIEDEGEPDEDPDDNALRQAAVAWNYMTHATYQIGDRSFTASECAEWWA